MGITALPQGQDAELSIRARGVDNGTAVTFTIYKASDDSEISTVDGTVERGKAVCVWPAEGIDPEGDEREMRIYFKAAPDGTDSEIVSPEMIVYLDYVEITTYTEDGSAPAPDINVRIIIGSGRRARRIRRNTDENGELRVEALPRGEVTIEWPSPVRFIQWHEEPTAATFKADVRPAFRAQIIWPTCEEDDGDGNMVAMTDDDGVPLHRQWVNLERSRSNPEQGDLVRLKVKVHEDDGPGKRGDEIHCRLEFPPENELSARRAQRGLPGRNRLEGRIRLRQDDAEGVIHINMGLAGGDTVLVHIGGTEACEDQTIRITNWRRLYYKAIVPECCDVPEELPRLDGNLEDVFIVYERLETEAFTKNDLPANGQHAYMDGPDYTGDSGDTNKYWLAGNHNIAWCRTKFNTTQGRRGMNMIVASKNYDGGGRREPRTTKSASFTRDRNWVSLGNTEGEIFLKHPKSGAHPMISGSWRSLAPRGHPDRGKRGSVEEDWIHVLRQHRKDAVAVVFPADAEPATIVGPGESEGESPRDAEVKHPVRVTLTLRYTEGPWLGYSQPGSSETVCTRSPGLNCFQETVTHELGHNMNQAVRASGSNAPPPGMSFRAHGETYVDHGDIGEHCYVGLDTAATHVARYENGEERAPTRLTQPAHQYPDYRDLYANVDGDPAYGTCVMFGGGPSRDVNLTQHGFCDKCKLFVKGQALTRLW